MKREESYKFRNWAGNIAAEIPSFYQLGSEAELASIFLKHNRIRIVGSAHSWSDICVSAEALVNLERLNRVISIDKARKTVRVQAGIKINALNELLDREGLALSNLGSISSQSLAGAISTGTHGTGIGFQILGSQILEFALIGADGEKRAINRKKEPELFNAAVVNLGCLGVVTEMTLQLTDSFNLHDITETIDFDDVIDNLETLLETNEHLKFWWLPPSGKLIVYRYNKTLEKRNDWRFRQILKDEAASVVFYRSLVKIASVLPGFAPTVSRLMTRLFKGPLDRIEKSYRVFNVPEPPVHRETEWAFDASRAEEILTAYREYILKTGRNFNFIQEIRFTKADDFWLSPSYGRDSLWIGFYNYEHEGWEELLPMHEEFAQKYGGRPHWGKEFTVDANYLRGQYRHFDDFVALRNEMDPKGKFSNDFIGRIF